MKYFFRLILLFLFLVVNVLYARVYDGQIKTVEHYNPLGDSKNSFKTIWFCASMKEYTDKEYENFDNHDIAFHSHSFQKVCTEDEEKMINMLNIQTGMYKGYYYPIKSKRKAENIQHTYMAYMAVPLSVFNIHINFIGVNRQYMLNYDLEPAKENKDKIAVFRIPSGDTRYDDDYMIKTDVTSEKVTIKSVYNHQTLTLTLTPKENLFLTYMRKWGFNKKVLINIQDSTAVKSLGDSIASMEANP